MNIDALFSSVSQAEFIERYWHRLPYACRDSAGDVGRLGTWEIVGELVTHPHADTMVVRGGERYADKPPTSLEDARELSRQGYTILVRHAERHQVQLHQLASAFRREFGGAVDVHLYATPPGHHGFSWHYDAEDVFILQTSGHKEYSLRKNTQHPWPLVETIPRDMQYEHETMPLMRVLLSAGDWLYIPCGYWHRGEAVTSEETAISLAVGVLAPAAIDVIEFLRPRLLSSLLWRQRLPCPGTAATYSGDEVPQLYQQILHQLASDLSQQLNNPLTSEEFWCWLKARLEDDGPLSAPQPMLPTQAGGSGGLTARAAQLEVPPSC